MKLCDTTYDNSYHCTALHINQVNSVLEGGETEGPQWRIIIFFTEAAKIQENTRAKTTYYGSPNLLFKFNEA